MKQKYKILTYTFLFFLINSLSYAQSKPVCQQSDVDCLLNQAKEISLKAKLSKDSSQKRIIADEGIKLADACVQAAPKNVGCYYYRAVNQGLDLETRLIGVKQGLLKMIADFQKVIDLNKKYDQGGALRAMGYVYLELPSLPVLGSNLVKDMAKADFYSKKALAVAPNDPQNLQLAGEIAFANKDYQAAQTEFDAGLKSLEGKSLNADERSIKSELLKWQMKTKNKLK